MVISILALLKGGHAPERVLIFIWSCTKEADSSDSFWRLERVRNGPTAPLELYDLAHDVGETKNLAQANPELVAKAKTL